jgi:DNA-binding PadR family transcriptional regulator
LEAEGLVTTTVVNIGKRVRKYYALTPAGKHLVKARVIEFVEFIRTMSNVLNVELTR